MTRAALASLLDLARDAGVEVVDRWGGSTITLDDATKLDQLDMLAALPGIVVTAYLEVLHTPIRLGDAEPDQSERVAASSVAGSDRTQNEVLAARSGSEIVRLVAHAVEEIGVAYVERGWCRTVPGLLRSVADDWAGVADQLRPGSVTVDEHTFELVGVGVLRDPTALPAVALVDDRPEGPAGEVWDILASVCDAAAWTNVADRVAREEEVLVGLHGDQGPIVPVTPSTARGGVRLLRWTTGTTDTNRDEALRYVLRLVTASAPDRLPDAVTVQKLAERQRIAFSRDRAAEVQRAIADGHRDTVSSLDTAARELADVIDEANKAASATIVGVLGILALVAESPDALPTWLILLAAAAATLGILAVLRSRWQRIADQESAIQRLQDRLQSDPLLPPEDRDVALCSVDRSAFRRERRAGVAQSSCLVSCRAELP